MNAATRAKLEQWRTYALVTLVSVLVWVWAEGESVSVQQVNPRVEFVSPPDGSQVITVVDSPANGWTGSIKAKVHGSTSAIDQAQAILRRPLELTPGIGAVPQAVGDATVELREALRQNQALAQLGVSFSDVEPTTVRVHIEKMTTVTMPVKVELGNVELEGPPVVSPTSVQVWMSEALAKKLGVGPAVTGGPGGAGASGAAVSGAASVVAKVDADAVAKLTDLQPQTLTVPVALVGAAVEGSASSGPVRITPPTVAVTLRLRSRTDTWKLESVPVRIVLPPTEVSSWDITVLDTQIKDVTVTGPRDQIQLLKDSKDGLKAYVELSREELEKRIESKAAVIRGVGPLKVDAASMVVRLKIEPRVVK